MKGKLFLIPTILSENALHVIPLYVHHISNMLDIFFVENEKTARRYLRKTGYSKSFDATLVLPINEQTTAQDYSTYIQHLIDGKDSGLLSEAGVPAVADPGSTLVALAHKNGIQVIPLVGPSSILLALMASGLNGQQFCFHGYLPIKQPERSKKILFLEQRAKTGETQICIETPYRNNVLIQDFLQCCHSSTMFCIAYDLTGPKEFVATKTIAEWRMESLKLDKTPAIFLLGIG